MTYLTLQDHINEQLDRARFVTIDAPIRKLEADVRFYDRTINAKNDTYHGEGIAQIITGTAIPICIAAAALIFRKELSDQVTPAAAAFYVGSGAALMLSLAYVITGRQKLASSKSNKKYCRREREKALARLQELYKLRDGK